MTGKDFKVLMEWALSSEKVPMTLYLMMSAYTSDIDSSKISEYIRIISRLPESDAKALTLDLLHEISNNNSIKTSSHNGQQIVMIN